MKRVFFYLVFLLFFSTAFSQYRGTRQNGTLQTTEDYVTNSPGNSISNSKLIARYKDSTDFAIHYNNIKFAKYISSKNDGTPTTILWTDSDGNVKKSSIPNWITTETDPIWASEKTNYYTKTLSDARYLQSFTESDPIWNGVSSFYRTKSQNDLLYQAIGSYITAESDPTVPIYSKVLTSFSIIKSDTDLLYRPIGYVPSFSDITSKPTTLIGYGITDAYPLSGNPSGFITSFSETDPLFNTKLASKTTTDLTEGANLYYTDARFDTKFSTKSTSDLVEGTNQYYNIGRFNLALASKSTSDLAEGSNMYFTNARSRGTISITTTGQAGLSSYNSGTGILNVPNYTVTQGTGISISSNVVTNTAPDQVVSLTAGNRISITGTYPSFTISYIEPTQNIVARTVNSNYTISSTKQATVFYAVTCSVTNPLLVGTSSANAYLEYSLNSGSSWLLPSQSGNSSGVGVTVTLQLTNGQTGILAGSIPANALVRIRTATTGTASVTYLTGQETY